DATVTAFSLHSQPRSILNRLRNMIRCDELTLGKVSNRSRQLQHTMKCSGRQMQLLHRGLEQFLGGWLDVTAVAYFGGSHFCIAGQFATGEALKLALTSGLHTSANDGGGLHLALVGELFIIDAGNLNVNIDAVEQWTTD